MLSFFDAIAFSDDENKHNLKDYNYKRNIACGKIPVVWNCLGDLY